MKTRKQLWMLVINALLLVRCTAVFDISPKNAEMPAPNTVLPASSPASAVLNSPSGMPLPSPAPPTATQTAANTPTQSAFPTPAPLTRESILACPVSLPNLSESPDEYSISTEGGYGNPERTLFIGLWPGGKVYFYPGGPGDIGPDGSLGMKFWFFRTIRGDVIFGGRRLDASAPPMPELVLRGEEDGYGETGFHPAPLTFPTVGCWEVTARIGEERMAFVTLVAQVPFEPLWPDWMPEGLPPVDADLTDLPTTFRHIFRSRDGRPGEVIVETSQGIHEIKALPAETSIQPVSINGQEGRCVRRAFFEQGQWQASSDASALEWPEKDLLYRIIQTDLGLTCEDLIRAAGS